MSLVTYAQNFEDLMLNRAFRKLNSGFYIDVGANDPTSDSVTKIFYDRGWCGINIEPTDTMFEKLIELRPRDINVNKAAWRDTGAATLYLIEGSEAFATLEPAMAALHLEAGRKFTKQPIATITLADLCRQHVGDSPIHFMKLDVEGCEFQALQGHDFARWRPWIVLIEAHGPDFSINHYQPAEDLLIEAGYQFVYVDGLNRFYIAHERYADLVSAFRTPPNVYDDWIKASERDALKRAEFAEHTRAEAWKLLAEAQHQVKQYQDENERLHAQLLTLGHRIK